MLWRANLYIKETPDVSDWNYLNPWNAPPTGSNQVQNAKGELKPVSEVSAWWSEAWGYKDWNRLNNGSIAFDLDASADDERLSDSCEFMSSLSEGSGRQVVEFINESTWHAGNLVQNAVGYSITTHDSPFEFNSKLQDQRLLLTQAILTNSAGYELGQGATLGSAYSYGYSRAPAKKTYPFTGDGVDWPGDWDNYLGTDSSIENDALSDGRDMNGVSRYPYRPSFSSERYAAAPSPKPNPTSAQIRQSSGVDCSGLVQRSMSYSGETYAPGRISGYIWSTASPGDGRVQFDVDLGGNNLWRIDGQNVQNNYINLISIVPGDIVYYSGPTGYHVMMVSIIENAGVANISLENIRLVEATWGANVASAINTRSINSLNTSNPVKIWIVGRLK
jgi:hypothetical protein